MKMTNVLHQRVVMHLSPVTQLLLVLFPVYHSLSYSILVHPKHSVICPTMKQLPVYPQLPATKPMVIQLSKIRHATKPLVSFPYSCSNSNISEPLLATAEDSSNIADFGMIFKSTSMSPCHIAHLKSQHRHIICIATFSIL